LPPFVVVLTWDLVNRFMHHEAFDYHNFGPIYLIIWLVYLVISSPFFLLLFFYQLSYWNSMEVGFILSIGLSIQASLVIGAGVLSIQKDMNSNTKM
jgi:hypothetical protein